MKDLNWGVYLSKDVWVVPSEVTLVMNNEDDINWSSILTSNGHWISVESTVKEIVKKLQLKETTC
jgi:hypothetical protein